MKLWETHESRLLLSGTVLLLIATSLAVLHVQTLAQVREESVPLVGQLPLLERKFTVLTQQMELTELETATRLSSQQEQIDVYALPEETDVSRLIATFEVLRDVLQRNDYLSRMTDVQVSADGTQLSAEFTVHEQGMKTINLLVHISGLLTIGDLLHEDDLALLLQRIEEENPSGLIALEQFLSADILRYAKDPKTYEEQLKKSFTSDGFRNAFDSLTRTSVLYDVKTLLQGGIADSLQSYKLWPLQMMAVKEISVQPGGAPKWYKLGITLEVFRADS